MDPETIRGIEFNRLYAGKRFYKLANESKNYTNLHIECEGCIVETAST